jgi:exodeoxyribonuclease-5
MTDYKTYLPFEPNADQEYVLDDIASFIQNEDDKREILILKGAAGTGKTSIMKAVIEIAKYSKFDCKLAAPTGRAANVIYNKTLHIATTAHSLIYNVSTDIDGVVQFSLKPNKETTDTIYIIDESSMVSDHVVNGGLFESNTSLMTGLMKYVFENDRSHKLIYVGDPYQLPPVTPKGVPSISVALSKDYIYNNFDREATDLELHQVMRQDDNAILKLATNLRDEISMGNHNSVLMPNRFRSWFDAKRVYMNEFNPSCLSNVIIICHTNKSVNFWNTKLRLDRFGSHSSLPIASDVMVVDQRNIPYEHGWLFKGDTVVIEDVNEQIREFGGMYFFEATLRLERAGHNERIKKLINLTHLRSDKGVLTPQMEKNLIAEAHRTNQKFRDSKNPLDDPYVSALRLRYGYAITCHKAQGGEWDTVLVDPYVIGLRENRSRWLYTAFTRAKKDLYSWLKAG